MDTLKDKLSSIFAQLKSTEESVSTLDSELKNTVPAEEVDTFTRLVMATGSVIIAQKIALTIADAYGLSPEQVDLSFIKYD